MKIGIFDSGFGGLSVMRALKEALPHQDIIYFGDTARLPYGNKSPDTVLRYAKEGVSFLLEKDADLLIIACHTACTIALQELQKNFSIPILGVTQPTLELALTKGRIGIWGTQATIRSRFYQNALQTELALACPLLVPLVEEGYTAHPLAELALKEYAAPFKGKIDALILACTHYPLLRPLIQKELPGVELIDPALCLADQIKKTVATAAGPARYAFFVSDDPEKFNRFGPLFLGASIASSSVSSVSSVV